MSWKHSISSIRYKLFVGVLLTTVSALLISSVIMMAYDLADYKERLRRDIDTQAQLLGLSSEPALEFGDRELATNNLALLKVQPQIRAAAIYDAEGELFATYDGEIGTRTKFPTAPQATGQQVESGYLLVAKTIGVDGEIVGTVYIKARYPVDERLRRDVGIVLAVMVPTLIVSMMLALWLQSRVTRPILSVTQLARKVTDERDYSLRAERKSDDEIGLLVDSLNSLLTEVGRRSEALEQSNEEVQRLNKDLEKRVQLRTAELERANAELESFSYSVSHDLRTPLRAIDGFSQALLEDYGDQFDDTGRDYIARVRGGAQKMGGLIDDLLKLARVSRSDFIREALDLTVMAEDIVANLRFNEPQREVDVQIAPGLTAVGDMRLMGIALENMFGNAWKYTGKRTHSQIEFGLYRYEDDCFYIKDNGAGFDMNYINKLFGAFQRLHDSNEFSGTGVGLATVQRIIHRHGGRIWAEAKVDEGATFYFTLPRENQDDHKTHSAS